MNVQDALIDVIGGLRVSAPNSRLPGSVRGRPNAPGGGEIRQRDGGGQESGSIPVAKSPEERRRLDRQSRQLSLTLSVFNQETVFEAQLVDSGPDGICAETGRCISPGTSVYMRIDTRQAAEFGEAGRLGIRTTALGEVKWCRALDEDRPPRYRIGIRYYLYY